MILALLFLIVITNITLYDFFQDIIVEPIWTIQRESSDQENYIIVAKKPMTNLQLNSFRGKPVSLHPEYLLMTYYLNYLVKQSSGIDSLRFF